MMKIPKLLAPLLIVVALGAAPSVLAQDAAAPAAFTAAQLEQMVAPIALYPDSLVSQILMASTYPLEIVEAARWSGKNAGMKPDAIEAALKDQDWDPSVKSLCGFPDVLKRMNENLDWTTDLGDAFLEQQADVMDAVQRMRGKAYESGQLKSTKEQTVTQQQDKIIVIQPADPEVIYVPTYSPTVVYGAPPAPYYPAMYAPPGYGALAFTAGVVWGAAMWGNCNWGWGHSDVNIDVNKSNTFNRNTNANFQGGNNSGKWSHDPSHRSGANYRSGQTAQKYGAQGGQNRVSQSQARGYSQGGAGQRPSTSQAGAGAGGRTAGASPSTRDAGGSRAGASSSGSRASAGTSSSAFSGSRGGGASASSASSRGASSRGSSGGGASRGGGGGGSRGGGGGGGGRR